MRIALFLQMAIGQVGTPVPAVDYLRDVKPIFAEKCFACHGALKQKADLRLDTARDHAPRVAVRFPE